MNRALPFVLIFVFVNAPLARGMDCAEALNYASSYQAAIVNCIACNTTVGNLSFADANSICPGAAVGWCRNTDPTCSNATSGCTTAVTTCDSSSKPTPPNNTKPNAKPTNPNSPASTASTELGPSIPQSSPTAVDNLDGLPPTANAPNTQIPQQSFQQQQQSPNGQGNSGTSWSPPSSKGTKTSQTATQLPGSPTIGINNTMAKAGQARHMIQNGDRSKTIVGSSTNPVASRDEFDNPMRSGTNSNKPKNAVVPNNSGGNIPVSETAARLPPKMDKPLAPARSAYKNLGDLPTNSASGGSGGTVYAQEVIGFDGEEISAADRRPSSTGSNEIQPMDLNSYLPGGTNDRRRRLLMGEVLSTGEIHNRTVDLFRRITIRMSEFCANGELFDCR